MQCPTANTITSHLVVVVLPKAFPHPRQRLTHLSTHLFLLPLLRRIITMQHLQHGNTRIKCLHSAHPAYRVRMLQMELMQPPLIGLLEATAMVSAHLLTPCVSLILEMELALPLLLLLL